MTPLLGVRDLRVTFRTEAGPVAAVRGVSFAVEPGEVLGIVGESGSGKSVSLMAVLGLLDRRAATVDGHAAFRGASLLDMPERALRRIRGRDVALVSQDPMTALTPVLTIGDQIAEQVRAHRPASRRAARDRAVALLADMGIPEPARAVDRFPHELSGGMRQRAVIAMALSCDPALLVADEPTTALDATVQAQILDLLRRLRAAHGSSVVLVTHDMGVVAEMATRVAVMYAGRVVETGPVAAVFADPWHPYTWGLLGSIPPVTGPRLRRLPAIPGQPPAPGATGPGCAFAPRCPHSRPDCLLPPPERVAGAHHALCVLDADERAALRPRRLAVPA